MLLLAPDVRDWLAEGYFAHYASDLVDGLDLTAFYAPYEPRMMVKVLVYGYATGVFSSRAMARKLEEDVAFRVLGAGNFPSHRTLCEFRRRHLEEFKGMFVEVAREMGLASFGKLSIIAATELTSNASDQSAMVGLLDEVKDTFDAQPETALADAGYCNERDLSELERRGIDGYVVPGREGKKTVRRDAHTHPATQQKYKLREKVERFFNKLKQFRRIATRYDKLSRTFLAFIHIVNAYVLRSNMTVQATRKVTRHAHRNEEARRSISYYTTRATAPVPSSRGPRRGWFGRRFDRSRIPDPERHGAAGGRLDEQAGRRRHSLLVTPAGGLPMGRIVVQTRITNLSGEGRSIRCGMLVDTGAGALILPMTWKERLGDFQRSEAVELQLANGDVVQGEACWPVEIRIEGFRPVSNEVVFVETNGGDEEPLLGYVILEQAQAAVDMLGHRLVPVRYIDMK